MPLMAAPRPVPPTEAALHARLLRVGSVLLVAGLVAAALVYWRAKTVKDAGAIGYTVEGGNSYAVMPADSKAYNYEMERMEGKEGILYAEILDWFESLWHGRRLAGTLAVLSLGGFLGSRLLVRLLIAYPPLPAKPGGTRPPGPRQGIS
jgi:hypothetical protein